MTNSFMKIIYIGIFISLFVVFSYRVEIDTEYGIQTNEYQEHLTRACVAAVSGQEYVTEKEGVLVYLFNTMEQKEKAINTFFSTLEQGFNYVGDSNSSADLRLHVPALCLVDIDGFYITYNVPYTDSGGWLCVDSATSNIYTWGYTTPDDAYFIRFYLTDYIEVTNVATGEIKNGSHATVYAAFGYPQGLECIATNAKFESIRTDVIVDSVNTTLEKYINEYNFSVNRLQQSGARTDYDIHYAFELPKISEEDWCNLLDEPTALALLQGIQQPNGSETLNIYAMAGGELIIKQGFYIEESNNKKIYHRNNCALYSGNKDKFYKTEEQCAAKGAFPCPVCNP